MLAAAYEQDSLCTHLSMDKKGRIREEDPVVLLRYVGKVHRRLNSRNKEYVYYKR